MAWHIQLGFDERIMQKVEAKQVERQKFIFSILTLMLFAIGLLVLFSSMVYMLIIFHSWFIALATGLFLALIVFNIYRFLIVSAVNASYSGLAEFQSNHERAYTDYSNNEVDFSIITEEQIQHSVNTKKEELRAIFAAPGIIATSKDNGLATMIVRVLFISIFAVIFATGIELFIFKDAINSTLAETKSLLLTEQPDSWILHEILSPEDEDGFIWLNSNSLLLLINILGAALGYWKLLLDLLILIIFLMPLVLVFRSKEILFGSYVQELALHEIAVSHYHYLITQKNCALLIHQIKDENCKSIQTVKANEF
jgi:hypothetical protein